MTYKALGRMLAVPALLIAAAAAPAFAQNDEEDRWGKLEGTWATDVTGYDCTTGNPIRTFKAMNTFNRGGTMMDTTAATSPAQRSPGLGKWEATGGRTYSAVSIALTFTPAGVWTGKQKLTHALTVNGDQLTFTSTFQLYNTDGIEFAHGCASALATRL